MSARLKAPFPYFGGKSRVAAEVWARLGDVDNYIEPFFGSGAVLLARGRPGRCETVNDLDCYLANFWRALQHDEEAVVEACNWPINEADLHARHAYLLAAKPAFRKRMHTDPDHYDAKLAGWWVWGISCWIGAGWCSEPSPRRKPAIGGDGNGPIRKGVHSGNHKRPRILPSGPGIHALTRPQLGDAYSRGRGVHSYDHAVTCAERREFLTTWLRALRDRLRPVRVLCGHWDRACNSATVTTRLGLTGIFFDPPYSAEAARDPGIYAEESNSVAHQVRAYCRRHGDNPQMRLALCGYADEGHEELERLGWSVYHWEAQGGYGNRSAKGQANKKRERIWFSPHCLRQGLFE